MILRKQIDRLKNHFQKDRNMSDLHPPSMLRHLFVCTNHTTQKGAHIRDAVDLKRTMVTVIIALIPALIYGITTLVINITSKQRGLTFLDAFLHGSLKILP